MQTIPLPMAGVEGVGQMNGDPEGFSRPAEPKRIDEVSEKAGSIIGRYKLLQEIGEGGFGVVYMAEQETPVKRRVALKVIKAGMDSRAVIARFEAERQALAIMDHPNIARVLDAGATDTGRPYFVMELVKGIPITDYCDQASLGTRQRLELFVDVCRAVQHAHQKGIIHRDLKPSNIMVTLRDDKPNVKVIDFGIAKATEQKLTEKTLFTNYGQMIGTPVYMSPEQAVMSEFDVDTRSDIYSLGVLLYELLAGSPPFDAQTLRKAGYDEMRRIIREDSPQKPSTRLSTLAQDAKLTIAGHRQVSPQMLCRQLNGDLDWIVLKAIEKDRTRRYESASAFAHDIERHLNSEPVTAGAPTIGYKLRKFAQRHKGAVVTGVAIAALLLIGTAVSTWQAYRATRAEQRARGSEITAQAEAVRANTQKQLAEDNLIATKKAETEATQQRIRADHEAEAAQENLYYAQMHLGQQAWGEPEGLANMRDLLARWIPTVKLPDRRGWEWFYLNSLPYQNVRTLTSGWSGKPSTVAWHVASKRLAEGTSDGSIRIWDVDQEKVTLILRAPEPWVAYFGGEWLAWSPNGALLCAGCEDGTLHLWDTSDGKEIKVLDGIRSPIVSVDFSSDGTRLAGFALDGKIFIWDIKTGGLTAQIAHPGNVSSGAWSPDDKLLATGHGDGTVTVSSAIAGATPLTIHAHPDEIHRVAWNPDSRRLATTSIGNFFVSIWDVTSGKRVLGPLRHSHEISAIAWEPDGHRLASGSIDQTAKIWNGESGEEMAALRGNIISVESLSWGPNGSLASGASDGSVRIWNSLEDQEAAVLPGDSRMTAVSWSPDGKLLASAGDDGKIRIWNATDRQVMLTLPGHDTRAIYPQFGLIRSLAWRADGKYLASAGLDKTAKVWEVSTGREVYALPADHGFVWTVAWSPNGANLAAGSQDGTIRIVQGLEQTPQIRVFQAHRGPGVTDVRAGVRSLAWNPTGDRLASGGFDQLVKIWDPVLGKEVARMPGLHKWVMSVAWSPDGKRLASGGGDNLVTVWDPITKRQLATLTGHSAWVDAVAWNPDGTRLASAGLDNSVRIWDSGTGGEALVLRGTAGFFHDVSWNPDGARLAAASSDGQIRIWDATHGFERDTTARGQPYLDRLLASGTLRGSDRSWIADAFVRTARPADALALLEDDAFGLIRLAALFYQQKNVPLTDAARLQAVALLDRQRAIEPDNIAIASEMAELLMATGRPSEALPRLAEDSMARPNETLQALQVAALQAWFAKDSDYDATRRHMLKWAAGGISARDAGIVTQLACLRPGADAAQLNAILALARKAVQAVNGTSVTPWEQLSLGMAEYRGGVYSAADQSLVDAVSNARSSDMYVKDARYIEDAAGFYRAMSLSRQGKVAAAHALLDATAMKMEQLPIDERDPLANNASFNNVIAWLAYKEAKALFAEPGTSGI